MNTAKNFVPEYFTGVYRDYRVFDKDGNEIPHVAIGLQNKIRPAFARSKRGTWFRNTRHTLREPRWQQVIHPYLEVWIPVFVLGIAELTDM